MAPLAILAAEKHTRAIEMNEARRRRGVERACGQRRLRRAADRVGAGHLAREQISSFPGSAVLVIRALAPAAEATYAELGADLESALARVTA